MSEEFEKKLKQKMTILKAKKASQSQLEDRNKILETTLADNKKTLKKLKGEIDELEDNIESLEMTFNDMKLKQKQKEEEEALLRIEIERRIREEIEIKRKVEEEISKIRITTTTTTYVEEEEEHEREGEDDDKNSYCDVCDKQLCDTNSLKKHLQSKQHLKVVEDKKNSSEEKHQKKRKAIPKAVRTTLWNIHFSEDKAKGNCKVCDGEIKISNFEAGHIIASASGGTDNLDNLLPLCSLCNKSMGTENLLDFKAKYFSKSKSKTD